MIMSEYFTLHNLHPLIDHVLVFDVDGIRK